MKSTIRCKCGAEIEITDQLDADLRLIADHQAAEIERLRSSVNSCEKQLCFLSRWLEERFGINSNAVIGDLEYPPEKTLARVIVQSIEVEIKRLKEAVRVRGGCRMLSEGDNCDCGLCVRDNEIERLKQWQLKATQALSACYHAAWREGWQDGPTTDEAMDMVLALVPFPQRYELRDETM